MKDCAYQIAAASHGTENSLVVRLGEREFAPEEILAADQLFEATVKNNTH